MTLAAVKEGFDIENLHPVLSARLQIQSAEKERAALEQSEQALAKERLSLLSGGGTETPYIRSKLEEIEAEILRLQTRQRREQDKIGALKAELPGMRKEAQQKVKELEAHEERLPEASVEIEVINGQLAALVNAELVEELTELIEERNRVVKDFKSLPWLIQSVKSYFHLQPGIQEVEIPKLPEHINDLVGALSK